MKKVVLASLLVTASLAPMAQHAFAQANPVAQGTAGQVQMSPEEYAAYNNANTQSTPAAKAAAFESYLKAYPNSAVKVDVLQQLLFAYSQAQDTTNALSSADRLLAADPNNFRAYVFEVSLRREKDLSSAADFARKGLAATKPKDMSDADFNNLKTAGYPVFYSVIGAAALNGKDNAGAISAFNSELAAVPVAQTTAPGLQLQDTFFLAQAYYTSTPPDYLHCAYYGARASSYAPEPFKSQFAKLATYCYRKFHGKDEGYDAMMAVAKDNLMMPASLTVAPAPKPSDIVANLIATTPDLATLALSDKEYVLQNGLPADADKVFDTIKGKSVAVPGAVVVAATESELKVAVSDDSKQATPPVADFTFAMKEPLKTVPAVGSTIELSGTYASYTQTPLMITMSDGAVVEKKAPAKRPAPARRSAPRKR